MGALCCNIHYIIIPRKTSEHPKIPKQYIKHYVQSDKR